MGKIMNKEKTAWIVVLSGSIVGLVSYGMEVFYKSLVGEPQEPPVMFATETIIHSIPAVVLLIFILVSIWQIAGK